MIQGIICYREEKSSSYSLRQVFFPLFAWRNKKGCLTICIFFGMIEAEVKVSK